jgi:O-antigen/teichoic acid export membrane protein
MIARLKARRPEGRYGKNIARLVLGTALGQAIAVIASPVLTRVYAPNEFGLLAVYASIIGIIGSLASLSYHRAIPLPEIESEAANVFGLSLLLVIVVTGLTTIATILVGSDIVSLLGVPELAPHIWMIPLSVLGLASYEAVSQWSVRQKAFLNISRATVAKGAVQTGTQLILGFASLGPFGLLFGQLLGQWAGLGGLLRKLLRESHGEMRSISMIGMRAAALRYSNFFKFTSPAALFNVVGRSAPPLVLAYFFGSATAGFFTLGERVLMIPITLLSKNASQVFVASAPEFHRRTRLGIEVEHLFERMLKLGLAPTMILAVSAPILFAFVFGDQWVEAGHYVRWLSAWLLFVFISVALAPVVFILGRQKEGMFFQGAMAVGRIGSLVIGGLTGDALLAVALFGIISGLLWAIYLVWLLSASGVSMTRVACVFIKELTISLAFLAPVAGCIILELSNLITVSAVSTCVLLAVLRSLKKQNI